MRRKHKNIHQNKILSNAAAVVLSIFIVIVCCIIFSAAELFFIGNMKFSMFFSAAALITGCYTGNFICGKYRRRMGLLYGTVSGIIIYIIITAAGILILENIPDIKKLLLLAVSGAAGGVAGVNSKRPVNLRD
ncbi:MAG: TIGR04086 family membrane protein [Ruminococcus sp.]|nr:TIGR04086 family membrane protein [Ruminococcus sp.]